ncbi:type II toxin-antitoxin system RelE/ParE family toxin [Candidatus Peregrinibacteria bacterium]|jgi:mRNA interferase RelE/StbE|nr:type II toxin-antitoxin system RelE/ParE family toxin [Candidatus Peregrinibacteria bacterium]MBT3598601.1 type II toxin-antitoxin system RelE/ParE family toxin [Candidatus Peregrinibacteria bacterium]MBT4367016.1 type II toxin-antitoxin system RelE/ParE family toxin [Candidatus Peregrinibacteria bacterium]MBT4586121.1 type II toxin-antitoxin system RelE/ParE family toxin [Candidatus Peregrinibacteria bacterium]MBT6730596.1 type II toxin-antitoxin system RelE/ParE family toxin [Candidatus Pe
MKYLVTYSTLLNTKEIQRFPKPDLKRIKKTIEDKLTTNPEAFGKPLRFSLKGHRSLRVGDYRIIFRIENDTVKILVISHRSVVYEDYKNRLI